MRTTGTLLLLLILSARLYAGEILDSTETDLGSGFHELHTTEINGKFQYLYYHDRKLGQFGSYSISPAVAKGSTERHDMCDWIDNALVFTLRSQTLIYGMMQMEVNVLNYISPITNNG